MDDANLDQMVDSDVILMVVQGLALLKSDPSVVGHCFRCLNSLILHPNSADTFVHGEVDGILATFAALEANRTSLDLVSDGVEFLKESLVHEDLREPIVLHGGVELLTRLQSEYRDAANVFDTIGEILTELTKYE